MVNPAIFSLAPATLTAAHLRAFDSVIIIHAISASFAILLGAAVFLMRKGSLTHKALGRVWMLSMLVTCLSAILIPADVMPLVRIGPLSWGPIHALILGSLCSMGLAIYYAKQGNIRAHRGNMIGGYASLVIAGAFAFSPGRMFNAWSTSALEWLSSYQPMAQMILQATPLWVWAMLAALLAYGLSQMRSGSVSGTRAIVTPLIWVVTTAFGAVGFLSAQAALFICLPAALITAYLLPPNQRWKLAQDGQQLQRRGSPSTLVWVMMVFSLKYSLAVLAAMGTALNFPLWATIFGLLAGVQLRNLRTILSLLEWRVIKRPVAAIRAGR